MTSEKEKMLKGEMYDCTDPELVRERSEARTLCSKINDVNISESEKKCFVDELFGAETDVYITPPFYCDYGKNIELGKSVYFNFNCIVLDVAKVSIGDNVLFGPGVQILTASHPLDAQRRRQGEEFGKPITIGDDAWIGGGAIICPGVSIGEKSVIGAGSVVTRDIESGVVAAGNPCKVIRRIEE